MSLLSHLKDVAVKVGWTAESGLGTQLLNKVIELVRWEWDGVAESELHSEEMKAAGCGGRGDAILGHLYVGSVVLASKHLQRCPGLCIW